MKAPVFVVVLNYNGWTDTIECLESVLRSSCELLRVLVVDNGSKDGSLERLVEWATGAREGAEPSNASLRHMSTPPVAKPVDHVCLPADAAPELFATRELPKLTLIASPANLGFAGGNNVALRLLLEARLEGYVCLINNDMVIDPGALDRLVTALDADEALAAVGGMILDYKEPDRVQAVGGGSMSRVNGMAAMYGAGLRRHEVCAPDELGYVSGGWLLTRIDTMRTVGLMDDSYFLYAEDADWGERMRTMGFRLGCATDAVAWHKGSQTTGAGSPFQDYYIVRSSLMFVRKHAPWNAPFAAAYSVVRCLLPKLMRGQWLRARSVLRAFADYARVT